MTNTASVIEELAANDCAKALEQWYNDSRRPHGPFGKQGLDTSALESDLLPLFTEWFRTRETTILQLVCPQWEKLNETRKELGLHAMILMLAAILETAALGLSHYLATAVLIGCKWGMDGRCAAYCTAGKA
jgi:hypothetical protein